MSLVSFRGLCIDVADEPAMAAFWARAAGLDAHVRPGGTVLTGPTPGHTIWLNRVLEPKTVKHRVHFDLNGRSPAEYEAWGARVLPGWGPFAWTVMADPEDGEFCLFERDEPPAPRHAEVAPRWDDAYRVYELCVDAVDCVAIASWWADVFGVSRRQSERAFSWVEGIEGCPFDSVVFGGVPEPKTAKNRIHWDVNLIGDATVDDLVAKGATLLRAQDDEIEWTVLADPEGNEFCAFAPS